MIEEQENSSHLTKVEFKDKIDGAMKNLDKQGYVYNEILGRVKQSVVDEAVKLGAIIFRDGHYFVPVEERLVAFEDGKTLRFPKKVKFVSKKYYDFAEKLWGKRINHYEN